MSSKKCLVGNDYIEYLTDVARNAKSIKIMTFMVYQNEKGMVQKLLEELDKTKADVEIIVGIPYMFRCSPQCENCFNRSYEQIMQLYETADHFSNIKWHFRADTHCKMAEIVFNDRREYWYGSKNITDGDSADLMVKVDDSQAIELMALYEVCKRNVMKLNFGRYSANPVELNKASMTHRDYDYLGFLRGLDTELNCKMNTFVSALSGRLLEDKETYNEI